MVQKLLRLEGATIFLMSVYFYHSIEASWLLFLLLILTPDLSMIGYLRSPRVGAITYNLIHTYILVGVLIGAGVWQDNMTLVTLGLILSAHIGADRLLGFGLKYPSGFRDTHIQKL